MNARTSRTDAEFLRIAAKHFESLPTNSEDRAHWANIYNAENCRRIADELDASAIEARSDATGTGAAEGKSAVGEAETLTPSPIDPLNVEEGL